MKIIFAEIPENAGHDISRELRILPQNAEVKIAVYDERNDEANQEFYQEISDADAVITDYVPFNARMIDMMKKCRVISLASTGYSFVDYEYAAKKGIAVTNVQEYCTQEVSDHAVMMIYALQKGLMYYHDSVQNEQEWVYDAAGAISRIEGQTLGVIGLGKIGQAVAKKMQAAGMEIIAYDPYLPKEVAKQLNVCLTDMDRLLEESDVITIHMNLTEENASFFTMDKFLKMKKKPIFINVARGAMVNEEDLVKALDEGLIRAAGLDVLASDRPDLKTNPLLHRKNVIITPHSAYYSVNSDRMLAEYSARNAVLCLEGKFDKAFRVVNGVGL